MVILLQYVILVGGFSASDWLFDQVHSSLTRQGLTVMRPENHVYVRLKCSEI